MALIAIEDPELALGFPTAAQGGFRVTNRSGSSALHQFFTPEWAADAIVEQFFPHLNRDDLVLEPSCGPGPFLKAIPAEVPAVGVELDPKLAAEARMTTGREVICGDFRHVEIGHQPTAIIGNPPFQMKLIEAFLRRAHTLLPDNGRCGFILPAYVLQNANRVMAWAEQWSIQQTCLPRQLFHHLSYPILFWTFSKGKERRLFGFALYDEYTAINRLRKPTKLILIRGQPNRSVWRAAVEQALNDLGGKARLAEIYARMQGKRPTPNIWWKEKVRQVLQMGGFEHLEEGVGGLAERN